MSIFFNQVMGTHLCPGLGGFQRICTSLPMFILKKRNPENNLYSFPFSQSNDFVNMKKNKQSKNSGLPGHSVDYGYKIQNGL